MRDLERIGRYEILEHLATGGMGSVYLARATGPGGFERHAVLKMLDVEATDDDAFVTMFLDEARVIGRMHHQHIAHAHDLDRDHDGRYFLVMDYIHGQTAKAVWNRCREAGVALSYGFTLTVVAAAASALHYAHTLRARDGSSLDIVHRDVSPSNLMVGYDGAVKLIDFGIAKAANRWGSTQAGHVKGKLGYMAPEQLHGHRIDARTDIFALGVVLYELATMTRAFRGTDDAETIARIEAGAYVPPSHLVRDFPRDLEQLIAKSLHVDPDARFRDADEMRRELQRVARRLKVATGDAAVVAVMEVLFDDRSEPWQLAPQEIHDAPTAQLGNPIVPMPLSPTSQVTVRQQTGPTEPTRPTPQATAVLPSLPPGPTVSWRHWLIPIAAVALGALAVELVASGAAEPTAPAASARAIPMIVPDAATVAPVAQPPAPPPAPATVKLIVTTTPIDATVLLDGQRLGHTPYVGPVPSTPGPHVLKIRLHGYLPQQLDVDLSSDVTRALTLQPLK